MLPLIVIRPEPGCAATLAAAREQGLDAHGFPLFTVSPRGWQAPPADGFDALLVGSANALRHGGPALAAYRELPVLAVGAKTAEAAREAGLAVAMTGEGGLQAMLDGLPAGYRRLLRLAGEERVTLTPPQGVELTERIVYASEPVPMPAALADLLRRPCVVMLHSATAARHFAAECASRGVSPWLHHLAAIGPRVTQAAGEGWSRINSAAVPDDSALLALARRMCHDAA